MWKERTTPPESPSGLEHTGVQRTEVPGTKPSLPSPKTPGLENEVRGYADEEGT